MRRDFISAAVAVVFFTLLLGLVYPLAITGISQVLFPGSADGSQVKVDGKVVGSRLLGQDFRGNRRYFQSRPSATEYAPDVTYFSNLGPNSRRLRDQIARNARAYLALERPYNSGLRRAGVPNDAVQTSASGVDPHISLTNARIQAARVAAVRHRSRAAVLRLVDDHVDGRFAGLLGEPGVNVLELSLDLDRRT